VSVELLVDRVAIALNYVAKVIDALGVVVIQRVFHMPSLGEEISKVYAISNASLVGLDVLWKVVIVVIDVAVVVGWLVVTNVIVANVVFVIAAIVIAIVMALTVVVVQVAFAVFIRAERNFLSVGVSQLGVVRSLEGLVVMEGLDFWKVV